jgi:hypothetical protein
LFEVNLISTWAFVTGGFVGCTYEGYDSISASFPPLLLTNIRIKKLISISCDLGIFIRVLSRGLFDADIEQQVDGKTFQRECRISLGCVLIECYPCMSDFLDDFLGLCDPVEAFSMVVVMFDVALDIRDQLGRTAEDAAPQTLVREGSFHWYREIYEIVMISCRDEFPRIIQGTTADILPSGS